MSSTIRPRRGTRLSLSLFLAAALAAGSASVGWWLAQSPATIPARDAAAAPAEGMVQPGQAPPVAEALAGDGTHRGGGAAMSALARTLALPAAAPLAVALPPAGLLLGLLAWRRRQRTLVEAQLSELLRHDCLTGLPDREALQERLDEALACARREGVVVGVLAVELDGFGALAHSLGPAEAEALLRLAAERLCGAVRQEDILARSDAQEFALVLPGLPEAGGALRVAERLAARMQEPYLLGGRILHCGASIGLAIGPEDGAEAATLLRRAGIALWQARSEGGGDVRCYRAGLEDSLLARRRTERELKAAIARGALALHYQPLHDLPGRELVGFEALVRWPHPERGMIPPAEFIPLAEETGLIIPLGAWVLRTACRDAACWPGRLRLAVNLSPAQFRQGDLVATVRAALAESGLSPHRLELEITEGMLLHDTEAVIRQIEALRALGVRIAMDDFGSGYSSLGTLWRFPFDKLKIDRCFVRHLGDDSRAAAFIETIVSLGRALRVTVTAEGVETDAQLRALVRAGCDQVQGYLLGRPAPAEALLLARPGEQAAALQATTE